MGSSQEAVDSLEEVVKILVMLELLAVDMALRLEHLVVDNMVTEVDIEEDIKVDLVSIKAAMGRPKEDSMAIKDIPMEHHTWVDIKEVASSNLVASLGYSQAS